MNFISGLSGLFGTKRRMASVSLYRRDGNIFVVTLHGCRGGGDPCIEAGPFEVLPVDATPLALGEAIVRSLSRTTHNYPYPANQSEWKQVAAPLLAASSCKSWSAFSKKACNLRVNQTADKIQVLLCIRDNKGSFFPATDRERHLESPSMEQLGALVASELEFAASQTA